MNLKSAKTFWLLLLLVGFGVLAGAANLRAATPSDTNAFNQALKPFSDGFFGTAERDFKDFVGTYTNSLLRPKAYLYLAQAQIEQSNYTTALGVLSTNLADAGERKPDYIYWMAEALYRNGDYLKAIQRCTNLLASTLPEPALRLSIAVLQAQALAKLADWPAVIRVLSQTNEAFQLMVASVPATAETATGYLLLAEASLREKRYKDGEAALQAINMQSLSTSLKWQRQYLLCQILLADGRAPDALQNSTNLLDLQTGTAERSAAIFLQGDIWENLRQPEEALKVYQRNLDERLPATVIREALRRTIILNLEGNQVAETIQFLQGFILTRPVSTNLDLARMYLGDLYLQASFSPVVPGTNSPAAGTNALASAVTNLDRLLQDFPSTPLTGWAFLDRGWCEWAVDNMAAAGTNFAAAARLLPHSEHQAVALFKLADTEFRQANFAGAALHYGQILQDYRDLPGVTNNLFDLALYQIVQASIRRGDEAGATEAAETVLNWFPDSVYGERSLLLLGEDSNRKQRDRLAAFGELLKQYPNTVLRPEIQFAIARIYDEENDSTHALAAYDEWVGNTNFTTNALLLPQVYFARAWAYARAGQETNALGQMSNIVTQFHSSSLAPWAQNWIGDYFMTRGLYQDAGLAYQELFDARKFTNAGGLIYQARLMAGRAAANYQDFKGATNLYSELVKEDTNIPPAVKDEAYFQLGYTTLQLALQSYLAGKTNGDPLLGRAIDCLRHLTNADNVLAPQAYGQLGNCSFAYAGLQTNVSAYTDAIPMYQAELDLPQADMMARNEAEYCLGQISEKLGKPEDAWYYYFKVLDDPAAIPSWVKQTGVAAAALCEKRGEWDKAIRVYQRVKMAYPSLRKEMELKIADAQLRSKAP